MSSDRERMKADLMNQTRESHETKDKKFFGQTYYKDPGLPQWECKIMKHQLDLIPWFCGPNHPQKPEGSFVYNWDVNIHTKCGVNNSRHLCAATNHRWQGPCPVCEYQKMLREAGVTFKDPRMADLRPKRRNGYNIYCWDTIEEQQKGLQFWEVAHFFFEKTVATMAQMPNPTGGNFGGGYIVFSDPYDGRQITFEVTGTKDSQDYIGHQFWERKGYTITEDVLKAASILDNFLIAPNYDAIHEEFYQGKEKPVAMEKAMDEMPASERAKLQTGPKRMFMGGPGPGAAAPAPGPAAAPAPSAPADPACPAGGIFGQDCDKLMQCETCTTYRMCSRKAREAQGGAPAPAPAANPAPTSAASPAPAANPTPAPAAAPAPTPASGPAASPSPGGLMIRKREV